MQTDYAVRLLEQMKHYLTSDKITVVYSINLEELQHTINIIMDRNLMRVGIWIAFLISTSNSCFRHGKDLLKNGIANGLCVRKSQSKND